MEGKKEHDYLKVVGERKQIGMFISGDVLAHILSVKEYYSFNSINATIRFIIIEHKRKIGVEEWKK